VRIRISLARLCALLVLSVALSLATASAASAGAVQALPGCTASVLPANDDSSTAAVTRRGLLQRPGRQAEQLPAPSGPAGHDFDIVFNYDKVQWETGSASGGSGGFGGTRAAAGWANGDGEHCDLRPGSFDSMALLDSNASTGLIHGMLASTQPGRYVFTVRNAAVSGPVLDGQVEDSNGSNVVNGPVEICPMPSGPCRVRNTNQQGNYRATGLANGTRGRTRVGGRGCSKRLRPLGAFTAALAL
jgi:hypothetical protein